MKRPNDMRVRILEAALGLLIQGGREAVSTRAVTSALNIQAPTIYRIFGDKQGLLDAVAVYGFESHLASWQGWQPNMDPVEEIRQGWDMHVRWGIENPQVYSIAYGDARPGVNSLAAQAISSILVTLVEKSASAGLLRLPVAQAVNVLRAYGTGVVFTLIAMPPDQRDLRLSERGLESALSAILVDLGSLKEVSHSGAAMQLKANVATTTKFSQNEKALLSEWLDRIASE